MKWIKRILILLVSIVLLLFAVLFLYMKNDAKNPYTKPDPIPVAVPTFTEVELPYDHNFVSEHHLPIMGAGIIDIDNDGVPELWLGGGRDQQDGLFKYSDGSFNDIANQTGLNDKSSTSQSYGPTCYDMDMDGDQDLIITRDDGIFLYINAGGKFTSQKLNLPLDNKSTPVGLTCGDINGDGLPDIFVSTYLPKAKMEGQTIFLDKSYGSNSRLFANRGNMQFEDITASSGLSYTHNTFLAVMIDVDDDGLLDLVVAHDTGEARTYKNLGNEKFEMKSNPLTGKFGYPMGIAVGDYNNDSRPDFFFSNTGSTVPTAILKGDLNLDKHTFIGDWLLFENEGGFTFSEKGKETNLANFEFAWGAIFEDFNLDGLQDLVVAENYVDLPLFKLVKMPCRFLLNTPDHKFISTETESGVVNPNYAISPLTADFNNDGYPDLIYSNLAGRSKIFINDGGNNNYVKVALEQTPKSLGSRVQVITASGKSLTDWLVTGEGLGSDQSHTLIFGLGKENAIQKINIRYSDGSLNSMDANAINRTYFIDQPNVLNPLEESMK